ncbi:hypothetical protein PMIN01_06592 [Paraphaeosphaeria minitans]|uniref:Uncharacterized protein n=1 Tax=Paraphaeosphaeria minitans TaxID=565426 RepID=A0A9P6KQJ0_9PLEO|nr:hypothetical protein PMIN01_06592 [Paraphaeosphaeria minitans]
MHATEEEVIEAGAGKLGQRFTRVDNRLPLNVSDPFVDARPAVHHSTADAAPTLSIAVHQKFTSISILRLQRRVSCTSSVAGAQLLAASLPVVTGYFSTLLYIFNIAFSKWNTSDLLCPSWT